MLGRKTSLKKNMGLDELFDDDEIIDASSSPTDKERLLRIECSLRELGKEISELKRQQQSAR